MEQKILPTLLQENTIVPAKWMNKSEIANYTAIEFISRYFRARLPQKRHQQIGKTLGDKIYALKSGTASGKSTVLPPMLYKDYFALLGKNIAVTQPRVFNAINIPSQIIEHNKEFELGRNIGYLTGSIKRTSTKGLQFLTIGVLLQQLKTLNDERFMREYSIIVLDECHVRSEENDLTLAYLKKLVLRNIQHEECPTIILMSATFDEKLYMQYFDIPADHFIEVRGQSFPITEIWPEAPISNLEQYIVQIVKSICSEDMESKNSDILIFVDSIMPAKSLAKQLDGINSSLLTIILNRQTYNENGKEYEQLVTPIEKLEGKYSKKVFIATNVAETGVTLSTIKYCIDTGLQVYVEFNPIQGIRILTTKAVTQAAAIQRRGRVGRLAPGIWYPLYTNDTFATFTKDTVPNILVNDISLNILSHMISEAGLVMNTFVVENKISQEVELRTHDVSLAEFDWPTNPSMDSIIYSLEKLYTLGFIDIDDTKKPFVVRNKIQAAYMPTILGIIANKFRKIRCESIRMILSGYVHDASVQDLVTIAAFQDKALKFNKKYKPFNPLNLSVNEAHMYFKIVFADEFLEYVWLYDALVRKIHTTDDSLSLRIIEEFCQDNGIDMRQLLDCLSFRDELIENLLAIGLNPYGGRNLVDLMKGNLEDGIDEIKKIKACIYDGFRMQLATYDSVLDAYVTIHRRQVIDVISSELFSSPYMSDLTQKKPRNIIMWDCMLSNGVVKAVNPISILDGFLEVDDRIPL